MEPPPLPRRTTVHLVRLVVSTILQSTPLATGAVGVEDLGEGAEIEPVLVEPEEDRTVLEKQEAKSKSLGSIELECSIYVPFCLFLR
jgi:hypothetical protein